MELKKIYTPIQKELNKVDRILRDAFRRTKNESILKLTDYLLESPGKKIRPALVILSAKAGRDKHTPLTVQQLANIAAAIELIHIASLIHDDVVDHATTRHSKLSVNAKWSEDVSIALGDYLYSVGFELISSCKNTDVLACISQATKAMCEGELVQICERDNLHLLKERNVIIVKKKTASLFAACCQAGAIASGCPGNLESALKSYGLNFGIAFQILDDYLDIVAEEARLGKRPGQDIACGELTIPLLLLLESANKSQKMKIKKLLKAKDKKSLEKIKKLLLNSDALLRTKKMTLYYINSAKRSLEALPDSDYRKSLFDLADFIMNRGFSSRI